MNEEEKEKERIFLELQAEIRAGIEAYERGEGIPLEDVIAQLNSDR
jgi:predicted transcriptional regulator